GGHHGGEVGARHRVGGGAVGGGGRRASGPVLLCEQGAQVGSAEVDQDVAVQLDGAGGAAGAEGGELHRVVPSTWVRSSRRASKLGESLNRNRSSAPESESVDPASERTESGCQDGTTKRSPRVTDQVVSRSVPVPEVSKTWWTDEPVSRTGAVSAPRAMRCTSARMVGSTSAPVAGSEKRTAAWPGSTVPPYPSASRASWSARA